MKIGIFGDSFSSRSSLRDDNGYEDYPCWFDYLSENYDVVNHSNGGSSLFFSYDLFLKHHSKYDKVIFMITEYGRLHLPKFRDPLVDGPFIHVAGFKHLENYYNNYDSQWDPKHKFICKHIMNYLLLVQNDEEERVKHRLIVEDIQEKRSDALLVPGFIREVSLIPNYPYPSLSDVSWLDQRGTIEEVKNKSPHSDLRHCHMNIENNKILSEKIEHWINTGNFSMRIEDFVKSVKPYEYYFK